MIRVVRADRTEERGLRMDVKKLVSEMTLEEKAALCSGADF